jgi:hypothetical protein
MSRIVASLARFDPEDLGRKEISKFDRFGRADQRTFSLIYDQGHEAHLGKRAGAVVRQEGADFVQAETTRLIGSDGRRCIIVPFAVLRCSLMLLGKQLRAKKWVWRPLTRCLAEAFWV